MQNHDRGAVTVRTDEESLGVENFEPTLTFFTLSVGKGADVPPPNGFTECLDDAEILLAEGSAHLVVTHKSILRALLCVAMGLPKTAFRAVDVNNGGICVFRYSFRLYHTSPNSALMRLGCPRLPAKRFGNRLHHLFQTHLISISIEGGWCSCRHDLVAL
jgi:hypothetical protein